MDIDEREFPQLVMFAQGERKGVKGRPPCREPGREKNSEPVYQLKKLWGRHRQMIRMHVAGYNNKEIAETLGVTAVTVHNVLGSAVARREIELMQAAVDGRVIDTARELQSMNAAAIGVLKDVLEDDDAPMGLRVKVAMDNLSRTGFSPVIRGSLDVNHTFSPEEIEQIKRDAVAAGAKLGHVIVDAEFTEVTEKDGQNEKEDSNTSSY